MNLPNTLTILRIFFVPLLVAALVQQHYAAFIWRASRSPTNGWRWPFSWSAAATDLLDGYLARRWRQVTTIGTLLDPIADKLLISAALISLVQVRVLPGWMAILIIGREFAVSGLRGIAAAEGYTIRASDLGKTKMFSQVVAISCMLLSMRHPPLHTPGMVLMWVVVFFALISAVSYFRKFWRKVDERVKNAPPQRTADAGAQAPERRWAASHGRRSRAWAARRLNPPGSELNGPHLPLRPHGADGLPIQQISTPPALPSSNPPCHWRPRCGSGWLPAYQEQKLAVGCGRAPRLVRWRSIARVRERRDPHPARRAASQGRPCRTIRAGLASGR